MTRCCNCHHDITKLPTLCLRCHNASWCSNQCKESDRAHSLLCNNNCHIYTNSLSNKGGKVPIGVIQFAFQLADNDCEKAWKILLHQGVVLSTDSYVSDVLSGPEIVLINSRPSPSIGDCASAASINYCYCDRAASSTPSINGYFSAALSEPGIITPTE